MRFFLIVITISTVCLSEEGNRSKINTYHVTKEEIAERHALMENARRLRKERPLCEELSGKVTKVSGGCKLESNGLVYGGTEFTLDPLMVDGWLNPTAAQLACRMSRKGGHRTWRLPTEKEVQEASLYYSYLGIDPYLFYWTDKKWDTAESKTVSTKLPDKVLSRDSESKVIGYSTQNDFFLFDPKLHTKTTAVYGETVTTIKEVDRRVTGTFFFDVKNMKLVRPSLSDEFVQKKYKAGEVTGSLTGQKEKTVNSPKAGSESFDVFLGQSFGTVTKEVGRDVKKSNLGSTEESVDPRAYGLEVAKPEDVTKNQIGLFCVRDEKL